MVVLLVVGKVNAVIALSCTAAFSLGAKSRAFRPTAASFTFGSGTSPFGVPSSSPLVRPLVAVVAIVTIASAVPSRAPVIRLVLE